MLDPKGPSSAGKHLHGQCRGSAVDPLGSTFKIVALPNSVLSPALRDRAIAWVPSASAALASGRPSKVCRAGRYDLAEGAHQRRDRESLHDH